MKIEVFPSELRGTVEMPGSKSAAQRMVACALLARGESVIRDFPAGKDCEAALNIAQNLGAIVTIKGSEVSIKGGFPNAFLSGIRNAKREIQCGESGLASRMFTPIAALHDHSITVNGEGSLLERSFADFDEVLKSFGVTCELTGGHLPLRVSGPLQSGTATMDAGLSSQFLTGLLMALPRTSGESVVHVKNLRSKPYVEMTLQVLEAFGANITHENFETFTIRPSLFQPRLLRVPGDWSGAAFLLVAGALSAEDGLLVANLSSEFTQADSKILQVMKMAGVDIEERGNGYFVKASEIRAFEFDANDCPDLFPPLAALAAFADGASTIYGAKRLVHKESNRAKTLQQEFAKANIRIVLRDDEMKIYPAHISPAVINSHNDHRIAMAAAILGVGGARMTIRGAECVSKSFPDFFAVLQSINGKINLVHTTNASS